MIVNLTQHPATEEQKALGVYDINPTLRAKLKEALTFDTVPTLEEIEYRAAAIVTLLWADQAFPTAMVGGAGYLMPALERHLRESGVEPLHAFTRREVVERVGADGAVTKTAVFRHAGWVRTA